MSENLDLVRSIYSNWERGDLRSMEWAHPDIEYVVVDFVEPITRRGREATADAIESIYGEWDRPRIEIDEIRPLADRRVLVFNHLVARGKTSGIDVGDMHHNGAAILPRLRSDLTLFGIPTAANVNHARAEVHVLDSERHQLAAPKASVHSRSP